MRKKLTIQNTSPAPAGRNGCHAAIGRIYSQGKSNDAIVPLRWSWIVRNIWLRLIDNALRIQHFNSSKLTKWVQLSKTRMFDFARNIINEVFYLYNNRLFKNMTRVFWKLLRFFVKQLRLIEVLSFWFEKSSSYYKYYSCFCHLLSCLMVDIDSHLIHYWPLFEKGSKIVSWKYKYFKLHLGNLSFYQSNFTV